VTPTALPTDTATVTSTAVPVTGTVTPTVTALPTDTATPVAGATGTPTATRTVPAGSTATATIPAGSTATATIPAGSTATPTPCAMNFSDVPLGYWAYGYIKWAYCNGIVSGYAEGTFRPEAATTRGQVAKMVVLSAGFPLLTPPTAHFSDVPPGSPFYTYIETAYAHQVISGYADGTFRPSANVTRAQLTKLIVVARGISLLTPATPTYNDVPVGYWAYSYIETATAHQIVGGYDCLGLTPLATPAPPCRAFRPGNDATRAQLSKMLYQAFALPLR